MTEHRRRNRHRVSSFAVARYKEKRRKRAWGSKFRVSLISFALSVYDHCFMVPLQCWYFVGNDSHSERSRRYRILFLQKARQMGPFGKISFYFIGMIRDQKRQNDVQGYLFVSVVCCSPVYLLIDRMSRSIRSKTTNSISAFSCEKKREFLFEHIHNTPLFDEQISAHGDLS